MAKLKFDVLDIENDTNEINSWCHTLYNHKNYESVKRFALHGNYFDLAHLISSTYEADSKDPSKKQVQMVVRDGGEIVAFAIFKMHDLNTKPYAYLHYVVVRPDKQGKKIGEEIIHRLPNEIKKLFGKTPTEIYGYIEKENNASQALFAKLGADFEETYDDHFLKVVVDVASKKKFYE